MNALTPATPVDAPAVPMAETLFSVVGMAARDPNVDVAKLETLLRIQRELIADDARLQFVRAMAAAQGEMVPIVRDAPNDQTNSRYARLETIDGLIRPVYIRHGFCLSFNSAPIEGTDTRILCDVAHAGGHIKPYQLDAPLDTSGPRGAPNKTPLHGLGSTVSYLRRYLTCMIFNVILKNEDDDGNRRRPQPRGEPQTDELYALLAECSADAAAVAVNERKFLDMMGMAALQSMAEARSGNYVRLRNALLTKRSVLQQRAALNTGAKR